MQTIITMQILCNRGVARSCDQTYTEVKRNEGREAACINAAIQVECNVARKCPQLLIITKNFIPSFSEYEM